MELDLDSLRSLDLEYAILDGATAETLNLYEDLFLPTEDKSSVKKEFVDPMEKRLAQMKLNRTRMAERRANETSAERALRLFKNRERNKIRRSTETAEQRATRNRRNMERNRLRRIRMRNTNTVGAGKVLIARSQQYFIDDLVKVEIPPSPPREIKKTDLITNEFANR